MLVVIQFHGYLGETVTLAPDKLLISRMTDPCREGNGKWKEEDRGRKEQDKTKKKEAIGHVMRGTITREGETSQRAIIHNIQCRVSTGGCLVIADV